MARVVTSVTAFVSTMSPASANRARPPTPTTKERVNVLTATTRLTRSSLQSVGSCLRRPSVRSSPARQARPYWERPARAKWRNGESASTGIAQEKRQSSVTIPVLECSLVQTGHRCTAPNAYPRKAAEGRAPPLTVGRRPTALERFSVAYRSPLAEPSQVRKTARMQIAALANTVTAVRLSLHVLAATVWVGGQIVVAGLVPTVRSLGGDASKRIARAFGRMQWPAYAVLLITGIWNITAVRRGQPSAWDTVLGVKIGVVVLAGLAAFLHQRSKSTVSLAVWGAVTALASLAALVLGVLLAG